MPETTTDRVKNVEKTPLSDNWGNLSSYEFELQLRSGDWQHQQREVYDRGHAAAILLCNPQAGTVILTRQFRMPAHVNGENGWLVEACAGRLEGDDPRTCAIKEAREETGYTPTKVIHALDSYMSPGSVTEKLSLFIGLYDSASKTDSGGGLLDEGEDIEVLEVPFQAALEMIAKGEITDAKTIILIQHAALSGVFG